MKDENGLERAYLKAKCLEIQKERQEVREVIDKLRGFKRDHSAPVDERQIENLSNYLRGLGQSLEILGFDEEDCKFFFDGDYLHSDDKGG